MKALITLARLGFVAASLAVSASTASQAQTVSAEGAAKLMQIDRNRDGMLQPDDVKLGYWYRANPGKVDLSNPPSAEKIDAAGKDHAIFQLLWSEFIHDHGERSSYPYSDDLADREFRLPKPPPTGTKPPPTIPPPTTGRWLLRRSLDKIPAYGASDESGKAIAKEAAKLAENGALFSYGHHFPTGAHELTAEGCLAYEETFRFSEAGLGILGRHLYSLNFSRINFVGGAKPKSASPRFKDEASLLAGGYSYERLLAGPSGGGLNGSSIRFTGQAATDFELKSFIPQGEIEWTPYGLGLGSFTGSENFQYRTIFNAHADGGHVSATGKYTKSKQGDTFGHVGPKLNIVLIPFPAAANPFVLTLGYNYYWALGNEAKMVRAASADVAWYVRRPGNSLADPGIAITVSYKHSHNVENVQEDDSIIAGLAVGY